MTDTANIKSTVTSLLDEEQIGRLRRQHLLDPRLNETWAYLYALVATEEAPQSGVQEGYVFVSHDVVIIVHKHTEESYTCCFHSDHNWVKLPVDMVAFLWVNYTLVKENNYGYTFTTTIS